MKKSVFPYLLFILVLLLPNMALAANKPSAIYKVDTDKKIIALTFDISWGEKYAHPVLDVLEQKKVNKATFFLSGPWTLTHADVVKRIANKKYEIGSHGHKHKNFSEHSNEWINEQVKLAEDAIVKVSGVKPNLIRTPNGDFNPRVIQKLNEMGYQVIQWDTDSLDWKKPGVDRIIERVLKRAHPGDIILMHASDSCPQTPQALPVIIDELRKKGFEFATVSELLKLDQQPLNKPTKQPAKQLP